MLIQVIHLIVDAIVVVVHKVIGVQVQVNVAQALVVVNHQVGDVGQFGGTNVMENVNSLMNYLIKGLKRNQQFVKFLWLARLYFIIMRIMG